MHNPIETGKTIERLRKQAGYTQKSLAEALCVTDKAVSKWERGIASPNISLLPKLSALLDADMGALLSGILTVYTYNWKGLLILDESIIAYNSIIYDKPLVYYLISNFLLVGIKEILVVCSEKSKSEVYSILRNGENIGVSIIYTNIKDGMNCIYNENNYFFENSNILASTENYFYFGASLSRQLQGFMSSTENIIRISQNSGQRLPIFFIPQIEISKMQKKQKFENRSFVDLLTSQAKVKKLSRGIITVPFNSYENINEISSFINFFQRYHNQKICDILEIAKSRKLIR